MKIDAISEHTSKSTAGELLFDGYEDTLLSMADMMAKEGDRPMDKFAWFYKVSATSLQSTTILLISNQSQVLLPMLFAFLS